VIAAADKASADAQLEITRRVRVKSLFKSPSGAKLTEEEVDQILDSPRARAVDEMLTYSAVGTGEEAAAYLADFQAKTGVQELITVHYADSVDNRVRSVEIFAEAAGLSERAAPATA
jgi:alkanesulfonate monooxygenase SsuD/methylene tetrahydromethanopterin reductase-like flavin-dependent oxidoreductase (luciferase family)